MNTHSTYSKDSDTQSLYDLLSSRSGSLTSSGRVAAVGAQKGSVTTIRALDLHGHARQESIDSQLSAYSTYSDRVLNQGTAVVAHSMFIVTGNLLVSFLSIHQ